MGLFVYVDYTSLSRCCKTKTADKKSAAFAGSSEVGVCGEPEPRSDLENNTLRRPAAS